MNTFFKTILIVVSVALLAWILPDTFHFATTKKADYPFIIYSSLLNDFLMQEDSAKKIIYKDRAGAVYSRKEADSLAPTFFYRQLMTDNRFPDSILGVAVTPRLLKQTNFFFRHSPRNINAAHITLYPLLESRPKRVDLSMPDDVVRFTDKSICFVDMETNRVNEEKSALFQRVFEKKGVVFPIKTIAGNPTARKDYDEGYFFTDNNNQFFHLKQMAGQPFLRKIDVPDDIHIKHIFVTEYPNRATFAFVTDETHKFHVLTAPDYRLIETGIPSFNPETDNMLIIGNMFDWNIQVANSQSITNYALNTSDFTLRDSLDTPVQSTRRENISGYIFPFELSFTSTLHKFFSPHISNFSKNALIVNILLAAIFFFIFREDKKTWCGIASLGIVLCGIFAFIPLWLFWRY